VNARIQKRRLRSKRIQERLARRKRRIARRLDKRNLKGLERPMMTARNIRYEIADKTRATAAGGIGAIHLLARRLGLIEAIDRGLHLFKIHLPYHESDHVLNIAYNLLAGGERLEHLELLRCDEAYLDALGARRIPDPTTAGDFCRRFAASNIDALMEVFNDTRLKVWRQQPEEFLAEAIIDADGTMAETTGACKEGMDINHKNQWGYHPLLVSLANTGEPLYIVNRSGSRPSHEGAPEYFDRAAAQCDRAGFKKVVFRGDADFSQTGHFDRWDDAGRTFYFGFDATEKRYQIAENLADSEWQLLVRRSRAEAVPRSRPPNVKQQIVRERGFTNIKLQHEHVAEFRYRPLKCSRDYRVVVLWKTLRVTEGQLELFEDAKAFFYITNDWDSSAEEIVFRCNERCDQENLIQQLKTGVRALTAPVDNLTSNWAYMVMAALAWSLKAWAALLLPAEGRWREKHADEKRRLLRMDFRTFTSAWMRVPAQIVRASRRLTVRLLAWNPWQEAFFRLIDQLQTPLRC
jgi:hypothetical protein